ncbi:MAG: hypothetical protein HY508_09760 [Acidobacteria bacterium]|nr:hypothetical protein [Acidobacteriota bacterium]
MFRFTNFIHPDETVREVRQKYPETEEVFERYSLRAVCYDCSIEQIAFKVGVPVVDLLLELDQTIQDASHVAA